MPTKFQNLKQDSITLYKNKGTRKKNTKEDWICAPSFCTVGRCNPQDCYKEILRKRPDLDVERKNRITEKKKQTKKPKITKTKALPQQKRKKQTAVKSASARSSTNTSSAKTTTTNKSSTKTKSSSSMNRRKRKTRIANTALTFPRECDPDMCKRGKCNPEECAEILLRNTRAAHKFSSVECACKIKSKQNIVAKVRSVQKDIARCFCTMDLKKNLQCECKSITSSSTQPKKTVPKPKPPKPKVKPPVVIQKPISKRRLTRKVRVSSTFSFKIEFVKEDKGPAKEKKIEPTKEPKQCYCALKLHEEAKKRMKSKSLLTCACSEYMKILSSKDTSTNNLQKTTESTTASGTSVAVTCKCSESESKKNQTKVKRCFCTQTYYEKKRKKEEKERKKREKAENKITQTEKKLPKPKLLLPYECEPDFCTAKKCNPIKCQERIQVRPKKQYKSIVHKCLCSLKLKPKKEKEKPIIEKPKIEKPKVEKPKIEKLKIEKPKIEKPKIEKPKIEKPKIEKPKIEKPKIEKTKTEKPKIEKPKPELPKVEKIKIKHKPVEAKTMKTQTIKVKPKKEEKPIEPKKPKRKSTYCYSSGYRDSYGARVSDPQPCKTKMRNEKCGCMDSGDSQPSQSIVRLGSEVSFSVVFFRNKNRSKNAIEDRRGRGDTNPNVPLGIKVHLSGQAIKGRETPIKSIICRPKTRYRRRSLR